MRLTFATNLRLMHEKREEIPLEQKDTPRKQTDTQAQTPLQTNPVVDSDPFPDPYSTLDFALSTQSGPEPELSSGTANSNIYCSSVHKEHSNISVYKERKEYSNMTCVSIQCLAEDLGTSSYLSIRGN